MNIVVNFPQLNKSRLGDIEDGETFYYKKVLYMKLYRPQGKDTRCACMEDGKVWLYEADTMVEPLPKAEFYPYGANNE